MSRVIGPQGTVGGDAALPFGLLAACWTPVLGGGVVWSAGHLASWCAGRGWRGPSFSVSSAQRALDDGLGALWPGVPVVLIWVWTAVLVGVAVVPAAVGAARVLRRQANRTEAALGGPADLAALLPKGVAVRAEALRPTLESGVRRPAKQDGLLLGRLRTGRGVGEEVRASWEDVVLAVMAPRAGKTTALAVPAVLDAPGPVVATSNKADLWATTADARCAQRKSRAWVFDPQGITGQPRQWFWDPLRTVRDVEAAHRLAGHFVQEVRGKDHRDFWTSAAHDLLTSLLLAAALSGRDLAEVFAWLNDPSTTAPARLLEEAGERPVAAALLGRQNGAPETRDGIYETARTAAQCLRDGRIMRWLVGDGAAERLDPDRFVRSRDALYLLSKDGAGAAAPLVAALTDAVMQAGVRAAEKDGGRLDPPMVVVLDEAANVCRISDLPELYSHLGSRGVVPLTILQSYRQGTRVWGDHGMDALWSASTCKVLGAGLDDARFVEDVSRLIGDHDVAVRSDSRGPQGSSSSISLRRQRILPPEAIRALPRGRALLLATGARVAMLELQPWFGRAR